jgi:hypothetical protein
VTVTARDTTGASGSAIFTWTVSSVSGCVARQLLGNPGFERVRGPVDADRGGHGGARVCGSVDGRGEVSC